MTVGTAGMSVSSGLGGVTYLLVVYAIVAVPIAVVTCAVVFGTTYVVLRVPGLLHGIAFPVVGAAVLLAGGIWDHQGPLSVSPESAVAVSGSPSPVPPAERRSGGLPSREMSVSNAAGTPVCEFRTDR